LLVKVKIYPLQALFLPLKVIDLLIVLEILFDPKALILFMVKLTFLFLTLA